MEKKFLVNGKEINVSNYKATADSVSFTYEGKTYDYKLTSKDGPALVLDRGGLLRAFVATPNRDGEAMVIAGEREAVVSAAGKKVKKTAAHAGGLTSPMPGKIFKVVKTAGAEVKKGETVLILEAMKMEHSIRADKDGKVKKINYQVGDLVQGGVVLAELE